jgi:hypothetical protein
MKKLDPQLMLADLRRVSKLVGRGVFSYHHYEKHGCYSGTSFLNHFGGWALACAQAGVTTTGRRVYRKTATPRPAGWKTVRTPKKDAPLLAHVRGRRRCLKCERIFSSWDVKKNRLCEPCNGVNAGLEEEPWQRVAI